MAKQYCRKKQNQLYKVMVGDAFWSIQKGLKGYFYFMPKDTYQKGYSHAAGTWNSHGLGMTL